MRVAALTPLFPNMVPIQWLEVQRDGEDRVAERFHPNQQE
jgi:hypothetical protein